MTQGQEKLPLAAAPPELADEMRHADRTQSWGVVGKGRLKSPESLAARYQGSEL